MQHIFFLPADLYQTSVCICSGFVVSLTSHSGPVAALALGAAAAAAINHFVVIVYHVCLLFSFKSDVGLGCFIAPPLSVLEELHLQ